MGERLGRTLSRRITRIKGTDYQVDQRIRGTYLVSVVGERALMRVRGMVRFPFRPNRPFVGARARLRARSDLHFGSGVTFGHGCYVDAACVDGVWLGDNTSVGRGTRIEGTGSLRTLGKGIRAGDNVGLGTDCFYGCAGGITLGDDTIVGNFVSFHAENHVIDDDSTPIRLQGVTHAGIKVGRNCWIGSRVTVLDGATIEDGCVIAAGSVVTAGTYPRDGIYGGIPARRLRSRV